MDRIARSPNTPFAFLWAGLVVALAYACMADPDPPGGHRRPATATEAAECDPAGGPCDPYPEGERGLAAHHGEGHCKGYDEPQDGDFETCPGIHTPCRGWGMVFDATEGDCVCRDGLVPGSGGHCDDPGWREPGQKDGEVNGGEGGKRGVGEGGGGGGGDGDDDDDPTLGVSVRCTPDEPMRRGELVRCTATPENAEGTVTYTWRFMPAGGGVRIWPSGDPESLPDIIDTTRTRVWGGEAAASGRVAVLVIDSVEDSDSPPLHAFAHSTFTVLDRGWKIDSGGVRDGFARYKPDLTGYLGGGGYAGMNVNAAGDGDWANVFEGRGDMKGIGIGPNAGYWIVRGLPGATPHPYRVDRRYRLNERLDVNGPEELRDTLEGDTVNLWTYMERRHSRGWTDWMHPRDFRAAVIRHEGYGRDTLKGHQGQIENAIGYVTCGDGAQLADRMVAFGEDRARALRDEIEWVANRTYEKAGGHHNVHGHIRAYVPLWNGNDTSQTLPYHYLYMDTPKADSVPVIARCDWSNF